MQHSVYFHIFLRIGSLALEQSDDCLCAGDATLRGTGKLWTMYVWRLWCQKQVSQAGISNCIPHNTVGCNYLSLPEIPASGTEVLIFPGMYCTVAFKMLKVRGTSKSEKFVALGLSAILCDGWSCQDKMFCGVSTETFLCALAVQFVSLINPWICSCIYWNEKVPQYVLNNSPWSCRCILLLWKVGIIFQ